MFIETYVLLEPLNSVLENHYFTIMSVITGLYVGLLAFMYPRIIDFKSKIQNEFVFLYKTFSHKYLQRYYLHIISGLLIFTLFSICLSIIYQKFYFIYINIICSVLAILLNFFLAKKIEKYLFTPDKLYKEFVAEIDFSKDLTIKTNMDDFINKLNELQSVALYFISKNISQFDQLEKYIDLIADQIKNYLKHKKDNCNRIWRSNDKNNLYYSYPLDRLVYISQEAIDKNKYDISIMTASKLYAILEYADKEDMHSFIKYDVLSHLTALFIYPARTNKYNATNMLLEDMVVVYIKLIKSSFKKGIDLISNTRPNNFLFSIIKAIINAGVPVSSLLILRNMLDRIVSPLGKKYTFNGDSELWDTAKYYVINATFDILSYMYYQERYKDIREYIGNKFDNIYCMLPNNMEMLIKYVFTEKNSILTHDNQQFNEYTEDFEYKFYIIFLILCLIKQNINIHNKNIWYIKKHNLSKQQKDAGIKFENSLIANLLNFNIPADKEIINLLKHDNLMTSLEKFLENDELFSAFKFLGDRSEYRKFIIEQLEKINEATARLTKK